MIVIASKEEKELLEKLRALESKDKGLAGTVMELKKQIVDLEIQRDKKKEDYERQERELKHMIGLEKKRQEFEIEQAKKEVTIKIREENLAHEKKAFEEQLKFNTDRFEKMESYLKDMMKNILERLPNVNVDILRDVK